MKARRIVNKLLEAEDVPDPKEYALSTTEPTELMRGALRDELVEKGWRHIHVRPEDEGRPWSLTCSRSRTNPAWIVFCARMPEMTTL